MEDGHKIGHSSPMANPQRIEVARVGEYWMRVFEGKITSERVLPLDPPLGDSDLYSSGLGTLYGHNLRPKFVRRIGRSAVWSIDDPSAAQANPDPKTDPIRHSSPMTKRQRIEVARVGEYWMRVHVDTDTVTQERVLPGAFTLDGLHPKFVKKMGLYVVWSIDEPTADERRCALENGVMILVEVTDSDVIAGANLQAAEWASKHALEKWFPNIPEPTRTKIRQIIKNAFEEKTPFSEMIDDIQKAGIFSEDRAAIIARTEISQAQVGANLEAWKKTGLVSKVKWLAVGPDPCPVCKSNDGEVRDIGAKFPSGDEMPLTHPNCYCIMQVILEES